MTTEQLTQPITVELCEVEGEPDLWALITVRHANTVIEVRYPMDEAADLRDALSRVLHAETWHRARWMCTNDRGVKHLARKGAVKVLCGTKRPAWSGDEWDFAPYFDNYSRYGFCKRCVAIYEKQTAQEPAP